MVAAALRAASNRIRLRRLLERRGPLMHAYTVHATLLAYVMKAPRRIPSNFLGGLRFSVQPFDNYMLRRFAIPEPRRDREPRLLE